MILLAVRRGEAGELAGEVRGLGVQVAERGLEVVVLRLVRGLDGSEPGAPVADLLVEARLLRLLRAGLPGEGAGVGVGLGGRDGRDPGRDRLEERGGAGRVARHGGAEL